MKKFRLLKTSLLLAALAILLIVSAVATLFKTELYDIQLCIFDQEDWFRDDFGDMRLEGEGFEFDPYQSVESFSMGGHKRQGYPAGYVHIDNGGAYMGYFDTDGMIRYHFGADGAYAVVAATDKVHLALSEKGAALSETEMIRMAYAYHEEFNGVYGALEAYRPLLTTVVLTDAFQVQGKSGLFTDADEDYVKEYRLDFVKQVGDCYTEPYARFIFDREGNLHAYLQDREFDWDTITLNRTKMELSLKKFMKQQQDANYKVESYEIEDMRYTDEGNVLLTVDVVFEKKGIADSIKLSDTMYVTVILD